ncbi:MAG TPA: hypothetical protein VF699_13045 [Caulobacteraceae bacterium]
MAVYTYYLLNDDGSVPAFEFDQCGDDVEARLRAMEVLARRPERTGVEIWRDDQFVGRHPAATVSSTEA